MVFLDLVTVHTEHMCMYMYMYMYIVVPVVVMSPVLQYS